MRFQTNVPIPYNDRQWQEYELLRLEFFWCVTPKLRRRYTSTHLIPRHLRLIRREIHLYLLISGDVSNNYARRRRCQGSTIGRFPNDYKHISHVHYNMRNRDLLENFPGDKRYWFFNKLWSVQLLFEVKFNVQMPHISWKIMEYLHVTEFYPDPKYTTLSKNIMNRVLSYIEWKDIWSNCISVSKEWNYLVWEDLGQVCHKAGII